MNIQCDGTAWRVAYKFSCKICLKEISERVEMLRHLKKEHEAKESVKHYFMSKEVYHDCLYCKLKKHKFNLATYEEKLMGLAVRRKSEGAGSRS